MSKFTVPIRLSNFGTSFNVTQSGFKNFYLHNGSLKLNDGSEKDVVLDRILDGFTPTPGNVTSIDTVLTALEKLQNSISSISYNLGNYYPSSNPANFVSSTYVSTNYVPNSRQLTINGVMYDLSANRSWTIPTGTGDMTKVVYDTNNDGIVDKAQAMVHMGRNTTASILYKGTVVYINGATGQLPNFVKAQANVEATSAGTFGVVLSDIGINSNGYVVMIGEIDPIDTRTTAAHPITDVTLAVGDTLYLHPTIAGYVTNVKPSAPNHLVYIGKVVNIGPDTPNGGAIVYRIQNGYELEELHNVAISSPANNDYLVYETATSLWKNKQASFLLGYHALKPASGGAYFPVVNSLPTTTVAGVANRLTLVPFIPNISFTSTSLFTNVTTAVAATNARILIFSDVNNTPSVKLYESANLDCSTTGQKTATTSFSFMAGTTYWIGVHSSGTQTFAAFNQSQMLPTGFSGTTIYFDYTGSYALGSVPSPLTSIFGNNVLPPLIGITSA